MKKFFALMLCFVMLLAFAGCSGSKAPQQESGELNTSAGMKTVLDPAEYVLYQNIFYNEQAGDYVDKAVTKKGVFTTLRDEYNETTRYYVWGYNDNTKCCDWQWEFVPEDVASLPPVGSTVEVTGSFVANEKALDKYWIEKAKVTVTSEYKGSDADFDMTTMGGTLERVQVINMQQFSDRFEGKSVKVYGRIEGTNLVQHPYYDNCFSQHFSSDSEAQPIGTVVIVSGVYKDGVIENATVSVTKDY